MSNSYLTWRSLYAIISDVEFNQGDSDIGLIKIINLLKKGHGSFEVQESKLIFIEYYNYGDYKWSTSVIGSSNQKYQVEKKEKYLNDIDEERSVIKFALNNINDAFCLYDEIYLNVCCERIWLDNSIESIKKKFDIHNNRYYEIMETSEYLLKYTLMLLTPPKELLEMIESQ